MVDKGLIFLAKSNRYSVLKSNQTSINGIGKIVYSDGTDLSYGDPAEIFGVLNIENEFYDFINSALTKGSFTRQYYGFLFGPYFDYDSGEIKDSEVGMIYAGVENKIPKKDFFELCLLLCNAKLNGMDIIEDNEAKKEDILQFKFEIEERLKTL